MAKLLNALNEFRPRIQHTDHIDTAQIVNDMASFSSLTKGDVYSFLKDLGDTIIRYLRKGNSIHIEGIGSFRLSISTAGKIKLHINDDPEIENELNKSHGFQGTILNKDKIGPDNQKIITAWNEAHPDDPVEPSNNAPDSSQPPADSQ